MQYENELKTITSISFHSHCKQTLSVLYWRVQRHYSMLPRPHMTLYRSPGVKVNDEH
jgi:hypothetical protein